MNIIFLSDLHLSLDQPTGRIDDCVETQFRKFEFVLDVAKKNNAVIIQAGDFFDKPRSWFLLPRVITLLKKYDVPIYAVMGQHDMYYYSEETKDSTSLGVLIKTGLVTLLNENPVDILGYSVYGASWGQEVPIPKAENNKNILVIHAPINTEWVGGDFINAEDFLGLHKEYDFILCADIHRKFFIESDGRFIFNTGPMVRRQANLYNFEHKPSLYYLTYDNGCRQIIDGEIPHESSEKVLSRDHIESGKEKEEILKEFVEKISMKTETNTVSFTEVLQGLIKENEIDQNIIDIISEVMSNG